MPSVLLKPAPVTSDTPHSVDDRIGVRHLYPLLMQMLLTSFLNNFQNNPQITKIERKSLAIFIEQAFCLLKKKSNYILENLHDQVLIDSMFSLVQAHELSFETLKKAIQKIADERYQKMGVKLEVILECETIVDTVNVYFLNNDVFMEIFHTHVWNVFFRRDLQIANRMARNLELLQTPSHTMTRSPAAIVAQNAVTFPQGALPFVPAALTHHLADTPVQIVHEPPVSLQVQPENDSTLLVSAFVNKCLGEAIANVIVKSAEETNDESAAFTDAFADLEVAGLVNAAAAAGESVFQDSPNLNPLARSVDPEIQPSSPVTVPIFGELSVNPNDHFSLSFEDVAPGNAEAAAKNAAIKSPIPTLPGQHQFAPQFHANGSGPLSVIPERTEDGADRESGKSSPLPDGKRRAPFTAFALSPQQCVEDGAPGAHPPFSVADPSGSAADPKFSSSNLGSTPSSGQSGTTLTHDLSELLATLAISSKSSFAPLAQSSSNPSGNVCQTPPQVPNFVKQSEEPPPFPLNFLRNHAEKSGKGAHSSDISSKSALSTVGVRGNPHADQPSSQLKGKVGGPPV